MFVIVKVMQVLVVHVIPESVVVEIVLPFANKIVFKIMNCLGINPPRQSFYIHFSRSKALDKP